jgi:single-stranded-DNA-specific exonuclease
VASKLVDKYHRPTIVLSIQDNVATGSGRSIDGLNLHQVLTQLSHLFRRFGGHYHAAGLSLNASNMEAFRAGLEEVAIEKLHEADLIPTVQVDSELSLSDLSLEMVKQIQSLAPFGKGNPEPVFYSDSLDIAWSGIVGENHLKFKVKHGVKILDAIGFGLAQYYPLDGKVIHMIYTPEVDQWKGHEKIQLRVVDLEVKTGH